MCTNACFKPFTPTYWEPCQFENSRTFISAARIFHTDLHKKSFLIRSLYSFVKWNSFFWFCCFVLCVILTLLFVFVVWCAFVASSKYYIHTCIHTLSRTASWYYYLIHSTFLCFSRNCPNLALINQSINRSINENITPLALKSRR